MREIVYPGIEQSKTECPFCGNVWEEHTWTEIGGCMVILELEFSAALAHDAKLKGKPSPSPPRVEVCPVCNKLTAEHTDDDQRSCVSKWRKRERGATGLPLQHSFSKVSYEKEEPDPVKRAQLQARAMQALCSCGKAFGDHTVEEIRKEIRARAPRNRRPPRNQWGAST
jgi:hypothetical protein